MRTSKAYVAIDVHARNCVLGWRDGKGAWRGSERFETCEKELIARVAKVPAATKHVTVEESTLAGWVARTVSPHVAECIVCDPRLNPSVHHDAFKSDDRDVAELSRLLWLGQLKGVYHAQDDTREVFKALAQQYLQLRDEQVRVKTQLKAMYHRWGVTAVTGRKVYTEKQREHYLAMLTHPSVRHQVQRLYAILDAVLKEERGVYREMLACGRNYPEIAEFARIPGVGPVGAHVFDAFVQTPERFSSKQKLWRYCRLAVTDRSSDGKPLGFRRLDRQGNPDLKAVSYWAWKCSLQTRASNEVKRFYQASMERTRDKTHARLNTQRKLVATMWAIWKNREVYRPEQFLSPADATER
jgi:transposase